VTGSESVVLTMEAMAFSRDVLGPLGFRPPEEADLPLPPLAPPPLF
jgi:hypothetical protein